MFGRQSMRLLRESWPNADLLAEELWAMFQDKIPLEHKAPVTITVKDGEEPPLTLRQFSDGPHLTFEGPRGPVGGIDADGDLTDAAGNKKTGDSASTRSRSGDASGIFGGVVVSGGPGDTYTVNLLDDDGVTVVRTESVKQLSINVDETIKPGTKTIVGTRGTRYFMQVPVWGEPS